MSAYVGSSKNLKDLKDADTHFFRAKRDPMLLEIVLHRYLAEKKRPPWDFHRGLGIVLLEGPKGARFLMSEVPLSYGTLKWCMQLI